MVPLSDAEYLEISASLEDYHTVFYKFLELASVWYCDDSFCTTAAISFPKHREEKPSLYLNATFWDGLTHRERLFVICHETLHVILDHGVRNGLTTFGSTPSLVNVAQDICINEMIVYLFGFDRNDIRNWKKYCWIDTCFDDPSTVRRNETFQYYLELLISTGGPKNPEDGGPDTLDQHGSIKSEADGGPSEQQKQNAEAVAQTLAEELFPSELEGILKALPPSGEEGEAGFMAGQLEVIIARKMKHVKFKFANLVKKLKRSSIKLIDFDVESFVKDDRRFEDLIRNANIALPGKIENQKPKKDRLLTLVFMDISGSCIEYFNIFQKVALAFEREKKTFDLRLFVFDTAVTEINAQRSARGAGGTNFGIIERKVLELEAEYGRYPDCVVVITDGEGTAVAPKKPKNWVWLLTPFNDKQFIHPNSKWWLMSDVVF